MMRTYSGHSTARVERALPHEPGQGQTGLSVAFDLPTQTGYDPDHPLARGEVGKVGVPVAHLGRHARAARRHPARRDEHVDDDQRDGGVAARALHRQRRRAGRPRAALQGTTQNDIVKEYLSRGTYIFPPAPSMRLIVDMIAFTTSDVPKWNPMNVCSYHLQEAGATPVQELAYALATAIGVLDAVKESGQVTEEKFPRWSAASRSSSTPASASSRRCARCAPSPSCGTRSAASATASPIRSCGAVPLRRAGQLARPHRAQPENNVQRIVLEMLGVTLSKTRAPAPSSCRPGTRRSACRGRGTSSGRCACSRCSPTRPTCSSTATSSTARR
jgi:(2R)-ethylmalonyl-CoA mutase